MREETMSIKMKKAGMFAGLMLMVLVCFSACAATDDSSSEEKTHSEGVETKCRVTGYKDYTGRHKSRFLKKGDKVAVISPSALPSEEQRDAVVEGLKNWGYIPVEGKYVCTQNRTLENCLEDLRWALEDTEIKGIFCVRGGYASSEIMDVLPDGIIEKSGKIIIGYSDITVYQSAWTVAGLPSIHASMSGAFMDLPEECAEVEENILKGKIPAYKCEGSEYDQKGRAEGILIGGNLSTFTSVINTAYDCSKTGKPYILFFEEVDSVYENVHRYLTLLKHAGVLDNAAGIIVGEMAYMKDYCETYTGNSRGGEFKSYYEMINRQFLNELDVPVAYGFPAGHGERNFPMLMGEEVLLAVDDDSFSLEWK